MINNLITDTEFSRRLVSGPTAKGLVFQPGKHKRNILNANRIERTTELTGIGLKQRHSKAGLHSWRSTPGENFKY
jgi:hypothetical protein